MKKKEIKKCRISNVVTRISNLLVAHRIAFHDVQLPVVVECAPPTPQNECEVSFPLKK